MSPFKKRRVLTGDKLDEVMEAPTHEAEDIGPAEEIQVKPLYAPRPQTVLCPLHRTPLTVQIEGNKKFAVCLCDVQGNRHKGQVVWQKFI